MKIRSPWLIKLIALVGACLVKLWMGTLRYRARYLGANLDPRQPGFAGRYIYAFWHENLLMPCYEYARRDVRVLISQHADGELIAQVCHHLGFGTIRGSSTRGGFEALRQMVRASRRYHISVIPDGPRGPRRQVALGMIYLGAKTGLPIGVLGFGFSRAWRLRTWDKFVVPFPWSRAVCVFSDALRVPADADREELESYRTLVEQAMNHVSDLAERAATPKSVK